MSFGQLIGDAAANFALIGYTGRSIGTLIPDVVVEESHHDEATITQHPVEVGSPKTDHFFMQPYTVEMRCGWSNSSAQSEGFVQEVYQELLAIQASGQPQPIVTGKRSYTNMLCRSLAVKTDETSEFALMVVALFQQIIVTDTQTTAATSANTDGSTPVATANPTDGGFTVSGGAAPVTTNSITPGADGTYGFSNSPFSGGPISLQPAPAGTPTVESLTANGGV